MLEYRLHNLVDNLIEILLLDAAEATLDVALDIASNDLTLDEAGFREGEAVDHIVAQRVGILRIKPVVRCNEHKVEHTVLINLQLVVADDDGGMGLESAVREEEADLYDVSLMVFHR